MKKTFIFLLSLSLCLSVGIILGLNYKQPTLAKSLEDIPVDKLDQHTVRTESITVNLPNHKYGYFTFDFIVDTKKGAQELKKREFQVKNFAILYLSNTEALKSEEGSQELLENLKEYLNGLLIDGEVLEIYFSDKLIS